MDTDDKTRKVFRHPRHDRLDSESRLLLLRDALHRTLDPRRLIDLFFTELHACVPYGGIEYVNEPLEIHLAKGRIEQNSLHYDIFLSEESLGSLRLTRARRFSSSEISTLEDWVSSLMFPLRNALMYQMATQSAFRDVLTGVENRRALDQALPMELGLAVRHQSPLSLMVLDIDRFKTVNDDHGHLVGDALLREAAQVYRQVVRATDSLYRYGGDEFVFIMRATPLQGALEMAERVRRNVANVRCHHGRLSLLMSVSIGVAEAQVGDTAQSLFARADQHLLQAKRQGRNRVGHPLSERAAEPLAEA